MIYSLDFRTNGAHCSVGRPILQTLSLPLSFSCPQTTLVYMHETMDNKPSPSNTFIPGFLHRVYASRPLCLAGLISKPHALCS